MGCIKFEIETKLKKQRLIMLHNSGGCQVMVMTKRSWDLSGSGDLNAAFFFVTLTEVIVGGEWVETRWLELLNYVLA